MQKILIAQDLHPSLLQRESLLRRSDIRIFTAATNDDLLNVHIEEQVNLIISKIDLPGASSESVFAIIRQSSELRKVSIILVCGNSAREAEACRQCGANAVLTKPFDAAALHDAVQRLMTIAPRQSYRVALNIAIDGKLKNLPFLCHMENISSTGMLIKTALDLAPGDRITCSFYLPQGPKVVIPGEVARIVHQAAGSQEAFYGIRYTNIQTETKAIVDAYITKEQAYRVPPAQDQRAGFSL